jgi:hypothetical protein
MGRRESNAGMIRMPRRKHINVEPAKDMTGFAPKDMSLINACEIGDIDKVFNY